MARRRAATREKPEAAETAIDMEPATAGPATATTPEPRPEVPKDDAAAERVYPADPHTKISISLSDIPGGPAAHLLRSHRFNQMQVRFDGQQPDERHLAMLKEAGWRDRTQEEGVYTKQIDRDAKWQSVAKMEGYRPDRCENML